MGAQRMIRVTLSDGRFLFGIDAENVRRLKEGKPLNLDLTTMGGTDKVLVMYGETMTDIVRELEEASGQKLPIAQPFLDPTKGRPS
jgi:hypothetical protein